MNLWTWIFAGLGLLLLGLFSYWNFILTEGAFFGRQFVVWMYNLSASQYDRIKGFDAGDEAFCLGEPLVHLLAGVGWPLLLDVAAGTGRLPLALLRQLEFDGHIVGTEAALKMIALAQRKTKGYTNRCTWVQQPAYPLPFPDQAFDAVTCLEALEFFPNQEQAIAEMVRVLRPGGILLISNRIGPDAPFFFKRVAPTSNVVTYLATDYPFSKVESRAWQEDYDLIWGRKRGARAAARERRRGPDFLLCPNGHEALDRAPNRLTCRSCGAGWTLADGIWLPQITTSP